MIIHSGKRWELQLAWYSNRWGLAFAALYGSWGFHLYIDICQVSLQMEIG